MAKSTTQLKRFEIPYFDGVNMLVGQNLLKKQELAMAENAHSVKIGTVEKRQGYRRLGNEITSTANFGIYYFDDDNANSKGMYRVCTVSATTSIYYLNTSDNWTVLAGGGTGLSAKACSFAEAEGNLFIVNGTDANRYLLGSDGTTVVTSATTTGHLYNSPIAYKMNYYKDKLYLGDYTSTTRYKTGIMMSSVPLGIVSLVDGDHTQPITSLKVTDTKYIRASDSLDIYRGGTKIGDITVTGKTEDTLTISSFATNLKSADEIWIDGTYTGTRVFRWADNLSGEDVKRYDTFKLSGGDNSALTMLTNVGDVMMIANKYNMATWDDYKLTNFDLGIGCVSDQGWVKALGVLFFVGYNGMYATTGGIPELISAKIQALFDGATKAGLEASAMGKKGLNVFAYLGDVILYKEDGSVDKTLSDVVIERNLRQENWYIHTGIAAKFFHKYVTSTDIERLEYCNSSGHVYEFLYGTKDNNTDEIPFRIDSGPISLSKEFEQICYPREIIIESERGNAIQCFVSLDDGEWYEIKGEAVKGITKLKVTGPDNTEEPARCNKISISLREFSTSIIKISRIAITYTETPEQEDQRT